MPIPLSEKVKNYDNTLAGELINYVENPDSIGFMDGLWYSPKYDPRYNPKRKNFDVFNFGMGIDRNTNEYLDKGLVFHKDSQGREYLTEEDERNARHHVIANAEKSYNRRLEHAQEVLNNNTTPSEMKKAITLSAIYNLGPGLVANEMFEDKVLMNSLLNDSDIDYSNQVNRYYKKYNKGDRGKKTNEFIVQKQNTAPTVSNSLEAELGRYSQWNSLPPTYKEEALKKIKENGLSEGVINYLKAGKSYESGGRLSTSWSDLSLQEKADVMNVAIKNGISSLRDIRDKYNEFALGGNLENENLYGGGGYVYDLLPGLFAQDGVNIVVYSDYRPGATVRGTTTPSKHALKQAADIGPAKGSTFADIRRVLDDPNSNTSRWLVSNGFGYLDETKATGTTKYWARQDGGDHSHYHIGTDSKIAARYSKMMGGRPQQSSNKVIGNPTWTQNAERMWAKAQPMYQELLDAGLSPVEAAGIIGNIALESSFDPNASNNKGGGHWGYLQNDRNITPWVTANYGGYDHRNQMNYLIAGLQNRLPKGNMGLSDRFNGYRAAMRGVTDPQQAALLWEKHYEKSANEAIPQRKYYAQYFYDKMMGNNPKAASYVPEIPEGYIFPDEMQGYQNPFYGFEPSNPQAFFGTPQSYDDLRAMLTPEGPVEKAAEEYSQAQLAREQKQQGLNNFFTVMNLVNQGSSDSSTSNNFLGPIASLASASQSGNALGLVGNMFAEGGDKDDDDTVTIDGVTYSKEPKKINPGTFDWNYASYLPSGEILDTKTGNYGPVLLDEITKTAPFIRKPLSIEDYANKAKRDYLTMSNDVTIVNPTWNAEFRGRSINPHLKDRAEQGAKSNALWEKEHPVLSTLGTVASAVPFAVASYPLWGTAAAAGADALAATRLGQAGIGLANTIKAGAASSPWWPWVEQGINSVFATDAVDKWSKGQVDAESIVEGLPLLGPVAKSAEMAANAANRGYKAARNWYDLATIANDINKGVKTNKGSAISQLGRTYSVENPSEGLVVAAADNDFSSQATRSWNDFYRGFNEATLRDALNGKEEFIKTDREPFTPDIRDAKPKDIGFSPTIKIDPDKRFMFFEPGKFINYDIGAMSEEEIINTFGPEAAYYKKLYDVAKAHNFEGKYEQIGKDAEFNILNRFAISKSDPDVARGLEEARSIYSIPEYRARFERKGGIGEAFIEDALNRLDNIKLQGRGKNVPIKGQFGVPGGAYTSPHRLSPTIGLYNYDSSSTIYDFVRHEANHAAHGTNFQPEWMRYHNEKIRPAVREGKSIDKPIDKYYDDMDEIVERSKTAVEFADKMRKPNESLDSALERLADMADANIYDNSIPADIRQMMARFTKESTLHFWKNFLGGVAATTIGTAAAKAGNNQSNER